MFVRLGLLVLLLAVMPALVLAGGSDLESPENDESGEKTELQLAPKAVYPTMFGVTFGGGFGYGLPVGQFYSDLDSGSLLYGDMRIAVSEKTYIKFGYRNMNIFEDSQVVPSWDGTSTVTRDITIDVRQYIFSIGWLFNFSKNHNWRMYSELGAGIGDHVLTYTYYSQSSSGLGGSNVMLSGQFGLLVPFNKTPLGMDVGVSVLWKPSTGDYQEGRGALIAAHLGLVLMLGGG